MMGTVTSVTTLQDRKSLGPTARASQPIDRRLSAPKGSDSLLAAALEDPKLPPRWLVRAFDITVSAVLLLLLAPVILFVSIALALVDGSPVFFVQQRVGLHARPFPLIKFRTMQIDAAARLAHLLATDPIARAEYQTARKLRNDPRMTRSGSLLRRLKIDEVPQLWNVLMGHMSIVGPRPVVDSELARYGPFGQLVLAVKPGLTGSWQVSDVDAEDYLARVQLDLEFAKAHNFGDIVRITAATPVSIVTSMMSKEFE